MITEEGNGFSAWGPVRWSTSELGRAEAERSLRDPHLGRRRSSASPEEAPQLVADCLDPVAAAVAHERRRIAADVHDLIMQDLALALAQARMLADATPEARTVVDAGERALADARDLVTGLSARPSESIAAAVISSAQRAARHVPVAVVAPDVSALPQPDGQTFSTIVHITRGGGHERRQARPGDQHRSDPRVPRGVAPARHATTAADSTPSRGSPRLRPAEHEASGPRARRPSEGKKRTRRRHHRGSAAAVSSSPATELPTVVTADDHPATRLGVRMALTRGGFRVVAEAGDCEEAVAAVFRERPGRVPARRRACPEEESRRPAASSDSGAPTAVVMLTVSPGQRRCPRGPARRSGRLSAQGHPSGSAARRPVRRAHRRGGASPRADGAGPAVAARRPDAAPPARVRVRGVELSARESEVLRLLRSGLTTADISETLSLSPVTVRRHISAGVAKLGVADRDAAIRAVETAAAA